MSLDDMAVAAHFSNNPRNSLGYQSSRKVCVLIIRSLDLDGDFFDLFDGKSSSFSISPNDGPRIDPFFNELAHLLQKLSSQDHHSRRSIPDLVVLRPGNVDESLCRRMHNIK